jgi:hydrogenase maturation protease
MDLGVRVVGLGQRLAGDDGVGLAIIDRLRAIELPPGVELLEAGDASALLPLLETTNPVVVLDALLGAGPAGEVVELDAADIEVASARPVSTHGLDIVAAIELARVLFGSDASPRVRIVGVRIASPARGVCGLSPVVSAAVARAVRVVLASLNVE